MTETVTKMKKHKLNVVSQPLRVKKPKTTLIPQEIVSEGDGLTLLIQYFVDKVYLIWKLPQQTKLTLKIITESKLIVAEAVINPEQATLVYIINSVLANELTTAQLPAQHKVTTNHCPEKWSHLHQKELLYRRGKLSFSNGPFWFQLY